VRQGGSDADEEEGQEMKEKERRGEQQEARDEVQRSRKLQISL
jgi:hypothetical protein